MTPFVYCIDEHLKNELVLKGYKLIKEESIQNKTTWVFQFNKEMQFDLIDKSKYFTLNTLHF